MPTTNKKRTAKKPSNMWTIEEELAAVEAEAATAPAMAPSHEAFARVVSEAARFAPRLTGQLAWIDDRCAQAGERHLDQFWAGSFASFFASGKPIDAILAGLRAGKTSSIIRAVVAVALFPKHRLGPRGLGVVPIMSARSDLATATLRELRKILCACGVSPAKDDDEGGQVLPGGLGGQYVHVKLSSGGGVIRILSAHGPTIEFRCLPAMVRAAVGYDLVAGFLDEVDVWTDGSKKANPASEIIDMVLKRATTTLDTARIFIASAHYPRRAIYSGKKSAHRKLIEDGDTDLVHISRLGEFGAERDTKARRELAGKLGSNDPRLLGQADPNSPSIPAWVANPLVTIDTCFSLAKNSIDVMFEEHGGRFAGSGGMAGSLWDGLAEANRAMIARSDALADRTASGEGIITGGFPGLQPGDPRGTFRGRGPGGSGGYGGFDGGYNGGSL
jgi:hypothetical protein